MAWLLCLLLALPVAGQELQEESLEIKNLGSCGLVTRYASSQINNACLQEALNIYLDEDAGISRRGGFAKYNTTALTDTKSARGLWEFRANDGTEYMVVLSSQTMFQSNGQGSFSAISGLNGLSATQDMDCSQCLGKLWCVNGSNALFSWDGSSTQTVSGSPTCQAIDCFRNRVVQANCSGTLSQLRLSGELDGADYTISAAPVSTSPASISVGGVNDGNKLTGIIGVYQDVLVLGKEDSTHGLYGFDRRDFAMRDISREVGLVDNRSAREKQGSLYWLSKRGVEKMTGPSITRVSDPVRDLIDTIIVAGGNSRSVTDTTQTDFQAGNLTASGPGAPMSATISPFSVVPGTWSFVDNSTETYSSGTLINVSTDSSGVVLSPLIYNLGLEAGTTTNWTASGLNGHVLIGGNKCESNWTYHGGNYTIRDFNSTGCVSPCTPTDPDPITSVAKIVNYNTSSVLYYRSITNDRTTTSCQEYNFDISTQTVPMVIVFEDSTYGETLTSGIFFSTSVPRGILQYGLAQDLLCTGITPGTTRKCNNNYLDFPFPYYVASGTFTSQAFDTSFSTPTWGPISAHISTNSTETNLQLRSAASSDGIAFDSQISFLSGNKSPASQKRYTEYQAMFTTLSATMTPTISTVTLIAGTTGYFISQCRNPGAPITSWGLFQCNSTLNDGGITFQVSTGATCNDAIQSTSPWTSQTNNSIVNIATGPYVAYRVLFDIDSGTETPTLNDCTINWNEGASRPSVSAEVYRERYYLAYTSGTSGTVANDHIAVLDSRDQWSLHDAPNCAALGIYNRKLYCGDSGATGRVYQADSGHDDDGAAFTSKIKTKDFDFGNPFQEKILQRMYFDLAGIPDQSYTIQLTPSYTLDASSDTFSLPNIDLNEDYSRFLAPKVPASLDYNTTGRWFSFSLSNSGTQGPWKIFGIRPVFIRLPED